MAAKPFAPSADPAATERTPKVLADGVHALTAEVDPNVNADFLIRSHAPVTRVAARR